MSTVESPTFENFIDPSSKLRAPKLSASSAEKIKKIIDSSITKAEDSVPGICVTLSNTKGENLFTHAAGTISLESDVPMTEESMIWLASGSKIVTAIASLRYVEKGLVSLDDPDDVDKWLPELKNYLILSKQGDRKNPTYSLKPKTKRITLRQLLTHNCGFGYPLFDKALKPYSEDFGIHWMAKNHMHLPLVHEPGEKWTYGIGIDWAGILISRLADKTLEDIFQENIFRPLGITSMTMRPTKEDHAHRVLQCSRRDKITGKVTTCPNVLGDTLSDSVVTNEDHNDHGGSGVFAQPSDYIKLFATILNKGVSPHTGYQLLSENTIEKMFTDQFPDTPIDAERTPITSLDPGVDFHPVVMTTNGVPPRSWGISWFINPEKFSTGRSAKSAFWCGFGNMFYWIDRERGITGLVGTHLLSNPFPDRQIWKIFGQFETEVYKGLEDSKTIPKEDFLVSQSNQSVESARL